MLSNFNEHFKNLQKEIISHYNDKNSEKNIKNLMREFVSHPVNFDKERTASNLVYIAKRIKNQTLKLEIFEQALKLNPENKIFLTTYGNLLVKQGDFPTAFEQFERAIALDKNDAMTLTNYANALVKYGDYPYAFKQFERAIVIDENDTITINNYANALAKYGDSSKAFAQFERALSLDINNETIQTSYAVALANYGNNNAKELTQLKQAVISLTSYAQALANQGHYKKAFELYEQSLEIDVNNSVTLNSYANALADNGDYLKAIEKFENSLVIRVDDIYTINQYAKVLIKNKNYLKAFDLFERTLKNNPNSIITLNNYAKSLESYGNHSKAIETFERSLALKTDEIHTINQYTRILIRNKDHLKAFNLFERALAKRPNSVATLNGYAKALVSYGNYPKATEQYEHSLEIKADNPVTLNSYANLLIKNKNFPKAFECLEKAQKIEPQNPIVFATFGTALAACGYTQAALEKFAQANQLDPRNILTLTNYGKALAQAEKYDDALELFEEVLEVSDGDKIALWLAAKTLQILDRPIEAVKYLEKIILSNSDFDNFISLNLGRLYYQLGRENEGRIQFDSMISNYRNEDAGRLRVAMNLIVTNPYSEDANKLLQEIVANSPSYEQAQRMLSLNLDGQSHFEEFSKKNNDKTQDRTQINRTLYHKIKNRIAVLKETLHDRLLDTQDEALRDLLVDVDLIFGGIKQRRIDETKQTEQLKDFSTIIEIISTTAHDIVDFVGNKVSAMREKVWELHDDIPLNDSKQIVYEEVLKDLGRTLVALNDLKTVNEGIRFNKSTFQMLDIFESWSELPSLRHANIHVELDKPLKKISTDIEKIRGFLDELVENSLKYNPDQSDLHIHLEGTIQAGLPLSYGGKIISIPGKNNYLHISVSDNGIGIPKEQKKWIFHPLTTTALDKEGSGLGLFGIRRTLLNMNGFIEENGTNGAHFNIYVLLGDT